MKNIVEELYEQRGYSLNQYLETERRTINKWQVKKDQQ